MDSIIIPDWQKDSSPGIPSTVFYAFIMFDLRSMTREEMFRIAVIPHIKSSQPLKKEDKTLDKQDNKHIPVITIIMNECGWTWTQTLSL